MALYRRQNFSFPDSTIYYITQNPSTPKYYQKLIKTCKYFYSKNSIIVLHCFCFYGSGWEICDECNVLPTKFKKFVINNASAKYWITGIFHIRPETPKFVEIASKFILKRIFRYETIEYTPTFELSNQSISLKNIVSNFSFFPNIFFSNVSVKLENGSEADLEIIVSACTKLKHFSFEFGSNSAKCSRDTVEKLLSIPYFSNIATFTLKNIPQSFDIQKFYEYLKKNKTMFATLKLEDSFQVQVGSWLGKLISDLCDIRSPEYAPLAIYYFGQDEMEATILLMNQYT